MNNPGRDEAVEQCEYEQHDRRKLRQQCGHWKSGNPGIASAQAMGNTFKTDVHVNTL